jgi:hypothetical protein
MEESFRIRTVASADVRTRCVFARRLLKADQKSCARLVLEFLVADCPERRHKCVALLARGYRTHILDALERRVSDRDCCELIASFANPMLPFWDGVLSVDDSVLCKDRPQKYGGGGTVVV